ncbi:hypothetical protein SNE40_019978 [Patella caerulea]|uniref:Uncharacterized protein n=1 Tax=Patella caerulea TaxID=87958 RepID=A0AAN8GDA5_PATCE
MSPDSSDLSSANVNNSGIEIFEAWSIASNKPSIGNIHDVLSKQQKQQGDEDNSYLALYHNDGTESEKSVSFVFVHDNSTSESMSVGKRNIEEDLADLERRRRRNKLLYGFLYDNYEDEKDDFKEKAKEAGEKEMEFIRIIEEDSAMETRRDDSPKQKKDNAKPKKQRKRSSAEKKYVQALNITSVAPQQNKLIENLEEIPEENTGPWVHPNQQFFPDGPLPKFVVPNEERVLPSHLEEMLNRRSASKSAEELEQELSQMQNIMNKEMAGPSMLVDEGEEGLTEEELKLAQELLQERVKEVSSKIFHTGKEDEEMKPNKKNGKNKSGKGKRRSKKIVEAEPLDRKKSYAIERESIREQRRLEKEGRLKEMKELQVKIMSRQIERKTKQDEAEHRVRELADEQLALQEEATAIKRDEEEARQQLAAIRQTQRAERDARRKAEQERRRQLVIARRQKEKEMRERARQKELEMLERIGDAETRRKLIEEEENKMEEEERLALQSLEEELNEQQLLLEEEEIRVRKLEREIDEEAMQRLIVEREAAERKQEELRDEEQRIRREEELQRQNILLEEERLIEEQRLKQLEDQEKIEHEKQRLEKLQKLEEEAREEMRIELYQKKDWAVKRREINLERRAHHDVLGYGHGLTRPWVFSYFALCPSASYNKTIDNEPFSGKGFQVSLKMKTKETAHNTQISNIESELPAIIEGGSQLHM